MIGRRAFICLLLGASAFGATAAPAALASTSGTTAVTCVEGGSKDFSDTHCSNAVTAGTGNFTHQAFSGNPTSEVEGTNASTKNETKEAEAAVLTTTVGGLSTEIVCTTISSSGTLENRLGLIEYHSVVGSKIIIKYTGCSVPKPAGQNCKIKGAAIITNAVKSESVGETRVEVFPESEGGGKGIKFTTITFEGCTTSGLNKAYDLNGWFKAIPSGATLTVNLPKNAESTLEFGGQRAGLNQVETVKMKGGNPITMTKP